MNREELKRHIIEEYRTEPDNPWPESPEYEVYRHSDNKKWFALIMTIDRKKLGLCDDSPVDIVNLKCDPLFSGSMKSESGFFPAYHMNKEKWITAALDGSADDDLIKLLVGMSYDATAKRYGKRIEGGGQMPSE